MARLSLILPLLFLLCALPLEADLIILKNGGRIEGKATLKDDQVHIALPNGNMVLSRNAIEKIVWAVTPNEVYQQMRAMIDPNDAEGYYQLALWCLEHKLNSQSREVLLSAIGANPDHEKARKNLGYERHEGRWITNEEAMVLKGYVKYQGQWMTPTQREELQLSELQKQFAEERRLRQDAEQRLSQAERRIAALEQDISRLLSRVQQLADEVAKPRYVIINKRYPWPPRPLTGTDTSYEEQTQK
jgi:hypothetical protein